MAYTLNDKNFSNLKVAFTKETGLDAATNMQTYIAYYQARMIDTQTQILSFILQELSIRKM